MTIPVLEQVPGQERAVAFLAAATPRPHHAYVLAGPEGSGKSLGARAFAASLLCRRGGCGACRDCRLALADTHPNVFHVEPEGREIHVGTIRSDVWQPAYRTPPEPGRKIFMIREADRLSPAAADTLLKVLEEPPADAVLILMSARAHELPETVMSRCHVVTFTALTELFVVEQLANEGVSGVRAQLAARLSGGNLGRARRLALAEDGLSFRDVAGKAIELSRSSPSGALEAAREVLSSAASYKEELDADERKDLEPFVDDQGREQDAYRAAIRRIKERYKRRRARAEREHVDRVLLGMSSQLRDCIATGFGGSRDVLMNPDLAGGVDLPMPRAVAAMGAIEEARASLAEDLNLNPRLVLEQAFLGLASTDAS